MTSNDTIEIMRACFSKAIFKKVQLNDTVLTPVLVSFRRTSRRLQFSARGNRQIFHRTFLLIY